VTHGQWRVENARGGRSFVPAGKTRRRPPARKTEKQTKACTKCGEVKPLEEFRRNPRMADGISSWCSACHVAATRDWRQRNRELDNERQRERYRAQMMKLVSQSRAFRARVAKGGRAA
jgi:hypothetical protein